MHTPHGFAAALVMPNQQREAGVPGHSQGQTSVLACAVLPQSRTHTIIDIHAAISPSAPAGRLRVMPNHTTVRSMKKRSHRRAARWWWR